MTHSSRLHLSVLASGSTGNCSVLRVEHAGGDGGLLLVDAGLSPRRTRNTIAAMGISDRPILGVVLTHLDHDHWHKGWLEALPSGTPVWCHKSHHPRARTLSMHRLNLQSFDSDFSPAPGIDVESTLASHDDLGSAVFRFTHASPSPARGPSLGYATDIGRVQPDLIRFLARIPTLAIESNYCPEIQRSSDRPQFLKDRIMDGRGHLSNEQCRDAIRRIEPSQRVVLLHLSKQCNTPERAAIGHANAPYELVLTNSAEPTPWFELHAGTNPPVSKVARSLFEGLTGTASGLH